MHHVMLDLETFGVHPGAVIRSIGAVEFELDGLTGDSFYKNVDQRSCEIAGLKIEADTKAWWARQPRAPQDILKKDPQPLRQVADAFFTWFRGVGPADRTRVWSHGAAFDPVLWQAAAEAAGSGVPWSHWNLRDTRTLYDLAVFDVRDMMRHSVAHSAIDDCRFQILCVATANQRLELRSTGDVFA